jgi:hypothetical protein
MADPAPIPSELQPGGWFLQDVSNAMVALVLFEPERQGEAGHHDRAPDCDGPGDRPCERNGVAVLGA